MALRPHEAPIEVSDEALNQEVSVADDGQAQELLGFDPCEPGEMSNLGRTTA
jgi:hypothetical protein